MKTSNKEKFYSNWSKDNWVHFYWWFGVVIFIVGALSVGALAIYRDSSNDRVRDRLQAEAFSTCMDFDTQEERDKCVEDYRTFGAPGKVKVAVTYE